MSWREVRDLRAGDADREATAERLRRAHGEGRLDTVELEERLERCYAAKTYADLDALGADLPRVPAPRQPPRPRSLLRFAPLVLLLIVIASGPHAFWLGWLLLLFVFFRVRRRSHWARSHGGGWA